MSTTTSISAATSIDPAPWYQRMREERPLYFDKDTSPVQGTRGVWQAFRYEDVQRGLDDFYPKGIPYDPKIHKGGSLALRSIINTAFAPALAAKLEEWISEYCERRLAGVLSAGKMDFVRDFSGDMHSTVIAQFLGVPESSHQQIAAWTATFGGDPRTISLETSMKSQREMSALFKELLEKRQGGEAWYDMVSQMLQIEVGETKLSTDDLVAFCVGLLLAGEQSMNGLLGNAMYTFIEFPEMQEYMREHPADMAKAVDEVIRLRGPLMAVLRIVEEDQHLEGLYMKKGEFVNLWMGSANRDPAVFEEPDSFHMNRDGSKIINFGYGIHFCLGNNLAKLQTRVALRTIFRKMRNIRLTPGETVRRAAIPGIFRLTSLPMSFDVIDE